MIPYRFHSEAERELSETALFYDTRLTGLGTSFVAEVERAIQFMRERPDAGFPLGAKVRRVLVRRFPYFVIYRRESDGVLILAVAHQHRRPRYWRNRK